MSDSELISLFKVKILDIVDDFINEIEFVRDFNSLTVDKFNDICSDEFNKIKKLNILLTLVQSNGISRDAIKNKLESI